MNDINKIKELGLPIVSPTGELALPETLISQAYSQLCMPFNCQMNWFAPLPMMMNPPMPFMSGVPITVPDISNINTYDAKAATYMHDFDNSLNNVGGHFNQINLNGGSYCPIEENELDYHQVSEVNTDAFTPNRKMNNCMNNRDLEDDEGLPLLEKLKGHPCKTEHVYNSTTKRMNKIIT